MAREIDPKTHERAMRLGASLALDAPFDVDELRSAVTRLVEQNGRRG